MKLLALVLPVQQTHPLGILQRKEKEKTTCFDISLLRSQVFNQAAQAAVCNMQ